MYKNFFKRFLDFSIALIAFLALSPVFVILCILLFFANKGAGVFFLQERPGKNGKSFKVIKFKSMTNETDSNGNLLPDVERLTRVGLFIRSTSLDEIPQLLNILRGDMSLIGPRPLLLEWLPLYDEQSFRRHEVRPGITGWAQIHGRNELKYSEKFALDVWYVDHLSFLLDLKIFLLTIKKVIQRSDVGHGNENDDDVDDLHFADRLKELNSTNIE